MSYKCHKCGTIMHRDHNAAKQILVKRRGGFVTHPYRRVYGVRFVL
ncbi:zinc ribbon domain-containing protein [Fischerella thermalis]